jgi:hypothetical protein
MKNSSLTKNEIKQIIVDTVKQDVPESTEELIEIIKKNCDIEPQYDLTEILIELENDNKLSFDKKNLVFNRFTAYIFSKGAYWFWVIAPLTIITALMVLLVPSNAFPARYPVVVLGIIFVLFMPGYAFTRLFFPSRDSFLAGDKISITERLGLCLALSLALVAAVGFILNLSPLGIGLIPITITLLGFGLILLTVALYRDYRVQTKVTKPN